MSSYSLLVALSGISYSAPGQTLRFTPRLPLDNYRSFFCTAQGWGTLSLEGDNLVIEMVEGELTIEKLHFDLGEGERTLPVGAIAHAGGKTVIRLERG
jgi:hypothetical protein